MPKPVVNILQVAVLVRDAEATMRAYHEAFGWGPWSIYELRSPVLHGTKVDGEPAACDMLAAIAPAGGVDIEVFQPLGPSPLADYLDQHGEGLHHLLCRREDGRDEELDGQLRALSPVPPIVESAVGDGLQISYINLEDSLKVILETLAGSVEGAVSPDRVWPSS